MYESRRRVSLYLDVLLVGLGAVAYAALVRHLYLSGIAGLTMDQALNVRAGVLILLTSIALVWFLARTFGARMQDLQRTTW